MGRLTAVARDVRRTLSDAGPRDLLRTMLTLRSLMKLLSAEGRADPYPMFQRAMRRGAVIYVPPRNWLVIRYDEASAALRDERLSSDLENRALRPDFPVELVRSFREQHPSATRIREWMLFRDGDDHARLRSLVSQAFTRRVVEGLRPRIEELANGYCDEAERTGRMELLSDLAYPLPMTVICDLLGIPEDDRPQFREWTRLIARFLDPSMNQQQSDEIVAAGDAAFDEFIPYFDKLVSERRSNLGDDLLSAMIRASDGEDRLTVDELLAQCTLLLVAGHETTANLIGNGMWALLRHPSEMAKLRADPRLIRNAIEELLRYESPVVATVRVALEEIQLGGSKIPPGHDVIVAIGAANRDPRQFDDPDVLNVTRENAAKHVAFSGGAHFCLGAPLARIEAEVVFTALLRRFERIECAVDAPEWRDTITLRGLKELPLVVSPRLPRS